MYEIGQLKIYFCHVLHFLSSYCLSNYLTVLLSTCIDLDEFFLGKWKVEELENDILDSKEKIELYRTKMQELVSCFFSSFCLLVVYVFWNMHNAHHTFVIMKSRNWSILGLLSLMHVFNLISGSDMPHIYASKSSHWLF